jgi:phosphopantothenoylcysteine decarboxylase/phosphopantothenate--cysteine ligase
MAAAVADYRPHTKADQKIKKDGSKLQIELEPTDDILKAVAAHREKTGTPEVVVGFAAESENLMKNAKAKLGEKKLDFIVANDISRSDAGFAVDTNQVLLLDGDGVEELPLQTKAATAHAVMDRVVKLLQSDQPV